TFTDATWVVEQAKAGRIRAIAVTSAKRSSVMPEVPTLAEAGYPRHRAHAVVGCVPARGDAAAAGCRQARHRVRSHCRDAGDHGVSDQIRQRAISGNPG